MTPDSLECQCSKFVKEFYNFHLIRNENPVPKNVLMTIFNESKSQDPTRDFKKRFQELKLIVKNIKILHEVLRDKRILEEINDFFQFCYNEGDLRFFVANAIHEKATYRLEYKFKGENLSDCQIDPSSDLGQRILAFAPPKLIHKCPPCK